MKTSRVLNCTPYCGDIYVKSCMFDAMGPGSDAMAQF
jgi:hypothetical protein